MRLPILPSNKGVDPVTYQPGLLGKVVLISGAGRGLGRSLALNLAQAGAVLALHDLAPIHLDETLLQVQAVGGQAKTYVADTGKGLPARMLIADVLADWGRLDGLVNNLHVAPTAGLYSLDEWDWERTLEINLSGPFLLMQSAIQPMHQNGGGAVINIVAQTSSQSEDPLNAAFVASQYGLAGLTQATAAELLTYNIFSCALEAGTLEQILEDAHWNEGENRLLIEKIVRWLGMSEDFPIGRWLKRSDVLSR